MAEDFACVIYAIETNNQPRFGSNWCRSNRHLGWIGRIINEFAAQRARRAISFPLGARRQHL